MFVRSPETSKFWNIKVISFKILNPDSLGVKVKFSNSIKDYCETATHRCGQNAICKPLGAEYNYDYECECEAGFTGTDSRHKDLKGSGYRSDCEEFSCEEKLVAPIDKKYEVVLPESEKGIDI